MVHFTKQKPKILKPKSLFTTNIRTTATTTDKCYPHLHLRCLIQEKEKQRGFGVKMNIATYRSHSNVILNHQIDKSHKTIARSGQASSNNVTFMTRTQGRTRKMGLCLVRACAGEKESGNQSNPERRSFLSLAEAGLVEISGLGAHEKFLCRLTISSLNLLRVISEQEGCSIEELNAGKICDWFLKDKLKREQNMESAVLQWDDPDFPF